MNAGYPGMGGGMDAGMFAGLWHNKKTGKNIKIINNVVDDEGMKLRTSDGGWITMTEFSRDYISIDEDIADQIGDATFGPGAPQYDMSGLSEVFSKDPSLHVSKPASNLATTSKPTQARVAFDRDDIVAPKSEKKTPMQTQSLNEQLLSKTFSKFKTLPSIAVDIDWKEMPKSELLMLINMLDVDVKEIGEYIYNRYCTVDNIKENIYKSISSMLDIESA